MAPVQLAVTTSRGAGARLREHAARRATAWGLAYVDRDGLGSLGAACRDGHAFVVFTGRGVRFVDATGQLAFHEGLARLRRRRVADGGDDPLVTVGGVRAGDRVLDATLGLAHDALVAAQAAGPTGTVVGLEASLPLAVLVAEGLRMQAGAEPGGAAPIEVHHADAATWVETHAEVFDVAYLDPMFSAPRRAEPGFDVLRRHAHPAPLSDGLIGTVRAHTRRTVVAKAAHPDDLPDVGWTVVRRTRSVTLAAVPGVAPR